MFDAVVYNSLNKEDIMCATGSTNCKLTYQVHYTPQLYETIPSQVYKD